MCFQSILSDADHSTDLTAVEAVFLAGQKKRQGMLERETCADTGLMTAHMEAKRVPRNSFWKRCPDLVELPPRRDACGTKWLNLVSSNINANVKSTTTISLLYGEPRTGLTSDARVYPLQVNCHNQRKHCYTNGAGVK